MLAELSHSGWVTHCVPWQSSRVVASAQRRSTGDGVSQLIVSPSQVTTPQLTSSEAPDPQVSPSTRPAKAASHPPQASRMKFAFVSSQSSPGASAHRLVPAPSSSSSRATTSPSRQTQWGSSVSQSPTSFPPLPAAPPSPPPAPAAPPSPLPSPLPPPEGAAPPVAAGGAKARSSLLQAASTSAADNPSPKARLPIRADPARTELTGAEPTGSGPTRPRPGRAELCTSSSADDEDLKWGDMRARVAGGRPAAQAGSL